MTIRFFRKARISENKALGYTIKRSAAGDIVGISFRGRGWFYRAKRVYSRGNHGISKNESGRVIHIDEPWTNNWHDDVLVVQFDNHKHPLRLKPEEISAKRLA